MKGLPGKKDDGEDEDVDAPKQKYVFLSRDGKAKMTPVKTGISDATHVAIASGAKPGDHLIAGPFRTLKNLGDGTAVQVVREETSAPKKS